MEYIERFRCRKFFYQVLVFCFLVSICTDLLNFASATKSVNRRESPKPSKGEESDIFEYDILQKPKVYRWQTADNSAETLPLQRDKGDKEALDPRGPQVHYSPEASGVSFRGIVMPFKETYFTVPIQRGPEITQAEMEKCVISTYSVIQAEKGNCTS